MVLLEAPNPQYWNDCDNKDVCGNNANRKIIEADEIPISLDVEPALGREVLQLCFGCAKDHRDKRDKTYRLPKAASHRAA